MPYALGALPSPIDTRDFVAKAVSPAALPPALDLRNGYQPVRNQGSEGTCVAHALAPGLLGHAQIAKGFNRYLGVRTLYEAARAEAARAGRPIAGEGCHVRDALKVAFRDGVDLETDRPYIPHRPGVALSTSEVHRRENKVGAYAAVVPSVPAIKSAIIQYNGVLVVLDTCDGFFNPVAGKVRNVGASAGAHAVDLVGWDDSISCFILRNSWGLEWGLNGYALIPYDYPFLELWAITPLLTTWTPAPRPFFWPWFLPWAG